MNADLKRVRETSQDDQSPSKRRAMSLSTPAVPTEYDEDGRDEWQRIVEVSSASVMRSRCPYGCREPQSRNEVKQNANFSGQT